MQTDPDPDPDPGLDLDPGPGPDPDPDLFYKSLRLTGTLEHHSSVY